MQPFPIPPQICSPVHNHARSKLSFLPTANSKTTLPTPLQVAENQQLKDQLQIIKPLLKATAKQLGLPEGPALLHLQHLQDKNKQLQEQNNELLTEQVRLQESDLALFQTQQQLRQALQQLEELKEQQETCEAQLQEAESDKTALIDYVQVRSK